jgi:hypothetical protein
MAKVSGVSERRGPDDHRPSDHRDQAARRAPLDRALDGVDLGSDDRAVLDWLGSQDTATIEAVAGMVERARLLERKAARKPLRGANLDDILTLLEVIRDALAAGQGDLAAMVLQLLLEHRDGLGLRSRRYAALLRRMAVGRDRPPDTAG